MSGNGAGEKKHPLFFCAGKTHAQSGFSPAKTRYFGGNSLRPVALSKRLALFLFDLASLHSLVEQP
jgi:hypothetical protein